MENENPSLDQIVNHTEQVSKDSFVMLDAGVSCMLNFDNKQ
jgi:hypothetical protein